jgi:hypothetical protein
MSFSSKRAINWRLTSVLYLAFFSIFLGFGFFGGNVDLCTYFGGSSSLIGVIESGFQFYDLLGYYLVTQRISVLWIGPFLVTFIFIISLGIFLMTFESLASTLVARLPLKKRNALIHPFVISAICASWPFYSLLTNALRQALSLSFVMLLISAFLNKNFPFRTLILVTLAICCMTTHKVGLLFVFLLPLACLINTPKQLFPSRLFSFRSVLSLLLIATFCFLFAKTDVLSGQSMSQSTGHNISALITTFYAIVFAFLITCRNYMVSGFKAVNCSRGAKPRLNVSKEISIIFTVLLAMCLLNAFLYPNEIAVERSSALTSLLLLPFMLNFSVRKFVQSRFVIGASSLLLLVMTTFSGQYESSLAFNSTYGRLCSAVSSPGLAKSIANTANALDSYDTLQNI